MMHYQTLTDFQRSSGQIINLQLTPTMKESGQESATKSQKIDSYKRMVSASSITNLVAGEDNKKKILGAMKLNSLINTGMSTPHLGSFISSSKQKEIDTWPKNTIKFVKKIQKQEQI